ncbi:hypothetical protein [Paenibacillus sp. OAS669]|uniref:phage scaffolding protein n=1 Tax=Paenibacillus sp. OAS669 TaxID=2663821 RepID=UPI00178AA00A|nr:hypothetical protein [Paenibacillus sp. OAS669]MBE1443891.1 hypothetical protein [Paenibacillus sp. OAS669]
MENEQQNTGTEQAANEEKVYLQADIDALQATWNEERATLQRQLTESRDKLKQRTLEHTFHAKAAGKGIADPAGLMKLINLSAITYDENDEPQGLDEILDAFTAAAGVVTPQKPISIGGPSNPPDNTEKTKQQLLEQAAEKARRTGRTEDRAAFSALRQKLFGGN